MYLELSLDVLYIYAQQQESGIEPS